MQIRPFSDLHLEFWKPNKVERFLKKYLPPIPTDLETVVIIAGDLGLAHRQETWLNALHLLSERFLAVVYVEGNHFFYKNNFFGRIHELKGMVTLPDNVHFLENESVEINGVVFIGATLWTDFNSGDPESMLLARGKMSDFHVITTSDGSKLTPLNTLKLHAESKKYIFDTLQANSGKRSVVVTHHGISPLSIHNRYQGNLLNGAYITDLTAKVAKHGPNLWIHGHTHDSFDYMIGRTRVIVNPFGYKDVEENHQFNKTLLIELC